MYCIEWAMCRRRKGTGSVTFCEIELLLLLTILPCYQSCCPRHTTPPAPAPPATKARRGGLVHISFCHSVHYRKRITVYLLFTFFFSFHNSIMGYVSERAGMYAHVPISSSSYGTIMTRVCLFFPRLVWSCTWQSGCGRGQRRDGWDDDEDDDNDNN